MTPKNAARILEAGSHTPIGNGEAARTSRPNAWIDRHLRRIVSSQAYRAEIDGVRFVALAIVVVGHLIQRIASLNDNLGPSLSAALRDITFVRQPYLGVCLFFGISGFAISSQFNHGEGFSWSPSKYYLRRLFRIEPPYLLVLVVTFLVISLTSYRPASPYFNAPPSSLTESLAFSALYLHDIVFGTPPRLLPPGWSLEIELQFYLVAPLICALLLRAKPVSRWMLSVVVLLLAILVADRIELTQNPHLIRSLFRAFPSFWVGIVLADLHRRGVIADIRLSRPLVVLLWASSLTALLVSATIPIEGAFRIYLLFTFQSACIFALMLAALVEGPIKSLMSAPTLSLIGGACYSIYLVHLQILQIVVSFCARHLHRIDGIACVALDIAVSVPIVLIAGLLFYLAIERPCMTPNWPAKLIGWGRNLRWVAATNSPQASDRRGRD